MSNKAEKQCKARTKDGQPCKAPPTEGGLCYFHANPDRARILGQKGGRKNRSQITDIFVPENATAATLGAVLDQAMGELLAGRMDPRVAGTLAQLVNTRRRITETVDLENRVAELERKLADSKDGGSKETSAPDEESQWPLWLQKGNGNGEGNGSSSNGKA